MNRRSISFEEIIQYRIISSKNINLQCICNFYWCNFMRLKKSVTELQVRPFKNCSKGHQHAKTTEDEKVYILNNDWKTLIHDWNTPIHLKNIGPHIVSLIFWFLVVTFNVCFDNQSWVNWSNSFIIFKMFADVWHWMKCSSNWYPW